jgi:hypothetical protein
LWCLRRPTRMMASAELSCLITKRWRVATEALSLNGAPLPLRLFKMTYFWRSFWMYDFRLLELGDDWTQGRHKSYDAALESGHS